MLRLHQDDGSRLTQWVDIIVRQTVLMRRLVDDLHDVSRIPATIFKKIAAKTPIFSAARASAACDQA